MAVASNRERMSAFGAAETATFPFPVRILSDDDALEVIVDVSPADIDDLTVEAGSTRVRIAIEHGGERYVRVLSPLVSIRSPGRFGARSAVYNNGVLTVSLEAETETTGRGR